MPLITEKKIRSLGRDELIFKSFSTKKGEIIAEQAQKRDYDVFISHAYIDRELILGLRKYLMAKGLSIYIDWIDDEKLDRSSVDKETAEKLRERMNQSKCLFFATTENYSQSKWMPWELGYFDGTKGKVAVMPMALKEGKYEYEGTEYLSLYPYVKELSSGSLFVYDDKGNNQTLSRWMDGAELTG